MDEKKKVVLHISGSKYTITTAEEESYVGELAREIDKSVHQMMNANRLSLVESLVLLSLSYLDAYKKSEESADNLRSQVGEYLEEASKARAEAADAQKEILRLENRLKEKEGR